MTQRIAVANLFALNRDIMASLDSEGDDARRRRDGVPPRPALHQLYAGEAGARQAQVVYLKGLLSACSLSSPSRRRWPDVLSSASVPDSNRALFVGLPGRRGAGGGR